MNGACGHTFPDNAKCRYANYTEIKKEKLKSKANVSSASAADKGSYGKKAKVSSVSATDKGSAEVTDEDQRALEDKGMLHEAACSVLMKILYAARMARPDLQRPTVRLTSYVTKWNSFRDKQLHRLICYIWSTLDYMQEGYIAGRDANTLKCTAYTDADFAGCVETQRSTTGGHLCLEGPMSHYMIHAVSKRQDSTSSSTPEADTVSADTVLRTILIPALDIWAILRGETCINGILKEDNEEAIRVMGTGKKPQ